MGDRKRDEKSGQFTEEYPLEDFVTAVQVIGPAGTTDIAEEVGCDRRTAYLKLSELKEDGEIESQKVGNALLWSMAE